MSAARVVLVAAGVVILLSACERGGGEAPAPPARRVAAPPAEDVPRPDLADMEPRVQYILRDAQQRVLADLGNAEEWGRYAMILDAHEVHAAAIHAYGVAQQLAPAEFRWRYLLARVLELQEFDRIELQTVENALLRAREVNDAYAPLHVRLGNVLTQRGRFEEACAAYERAAELDPDNVSADTGHVRALLSLGQTEAALQRIVPFAAKHPGSWEVQLLLARVYSVAGQRDRARQAADRARDLPQIAEYPDPVAAEMLNYAVSATACFKRARALAAQRDFENAAMNLRVVVEVRPEYAAAHERLAWCYLNLDKPKAARRHFETAIGLDSTLAEAHLGLADALQALGLPDLAAASHETGMQLQSAGSAR